MVPSRLIVFRGLFPPRSLYSDCQLLCKQMQYKRYAKLEESPRWGDCLSSLRHLFRKSANPIPMGWIGDIPKELRHRSRWQCAQLLQKELKPGDLIFLQDRRSSRMITHVVMALDSQRAFHCSQHYKGGTIERIEKIFIIYRQPALRGMLHYEDPRGEAKKKGDALSKNQ